MNCVIGAEIIHQVVVYGVKCRHMHIILDEDYSFWNKCDTNVAFTYG